MSTQHITEPATPANTDISTTTPQASTRISSPSLRSLIALGLTSILLGLLIIGSGAIYNMETAIKSSDGMVNDVFPAMHNVMLLQLLLSQAAMPPNDHLIHKTPSEHATYKVQTERIQQRFQHTLSLPHLTKKELAIVLQAQREWDTAQHTGNSILALPGASKTAQADKLMQRYDAEINTAINTLSVMHDILLKKALQRYDKTHLAVRNNQQFILASSLIGLAILILGAYFLLGRIFGSLRLLQRGVIAFSKGAFEHRIPTDIPAELSEIANGLNHMAEQLGKSYHQLTLYSYRDSLTGCLNKRKLAEDIQHECARSQRSDAPFSVLLLDLDLFKQVNDTYGHLIGDKILKQFALQISRELRKQDTLYRFGGEEFVALLPQTNGDGARSTAERIRRRIGDGKFQSDGGQYIPITASIGYATWPVDGREPDELLAVADEGLYIAKQEGRNCIRHA